MTKQKPGRPKTNTEELIRSTIYIPKTKWNNFRKYCIDKGINCSKLIVEFIDKTITKVS